MRITSNPSLPYCDICALFLSAGQALEPTAEDTDFGGNRTDACGDAAVVTHIGDMTCP